MDTLLQFVVSISIYVLIFVVIGFLFYAIDKRVKARLAKPPQCVSCKTVLPAGEQLYKGRLCAACAKKRGKVATHR